MRSTVEHKQHNYGYLLFLMAAAFSLFNRVRGTELGMAGYFFTSLIAYPGMMFLMGREAREKREDPHELRCQGLGLIALSFLQKVLLFWIETCLGREPNFYPFSTSGTPWLFMVGGMGLVLISFYRERKWTRRWLVPLTILVGIGIGTVKFVGDFLCLSRLVVYLPFLILGFLLEGSCLEKLGQKVWHKAAAAAVVLGWAGVCLMARAQLSDFRLLVDNNKWYKDCDGLPRVLAGIPARGLFYASALVLLIALLALMPGRKLPFLSEQGKRWKSGYFWFTPCAYLIMEPLSGKISVKDLALAGALGIVLLLVSSSKAMNKLPHMLQHWSDYAEPKASTSKELAGRSFYRKHRWGIQMMGIFSCCFAVAVIGFVYPYFSNGKNLVWSIDGLQQQYPALLYTGNYIREILQTLWETGKLVLPQWDFSIGFGLATTEVIRRDPLSLLLIFATEENLEVVYNCFVILRLYLCGLAFVWYCWELGKRQKLPIAMGAMVFLFSDFILLKAVRQPFFLTTLMTYFLLILVGVERYLKKGKPAFFVGIVALALFSDYYCAYINSVLMAVYLLCRLYGMYGTDIKKIVTKIVKMIGWYLWGAAMALCTLFPCLMAFLSSARSGGSTDIDLFYSNSYYSKLFSGLGMGYGGLAARSYVGFASIGLLACILLFLKRKRALRPLKIGLCVVTLFICLPIFGSIFNGFSYVTNRWCFAIAFVVAVTLVEMAPEFANMTARERKYMAIAVLVYSALVLTQETAQRDGVYIGVAVLGMSTVLVLMLKELFTNRRAQMGALAVVSTLNACFIAAAAGLPEFGGYAEQNIETDATNDLLLNYMGDAADVLEEDDGFYRVGRPFSQTNQSLMLDYNGVNAYYSVIASQITDYCIDVGLSTQHQTFSIGGLDERAVPSTLSSMKYYVTDQAGVAPYGFSVKEVIDSVNESGEDTTCYIFENEYALPLGYTYTTYVTRAEYEEMTAIEKQQVMLYGAVLEEETDLLEHQEHWFEEEIIPCSIVETQKVAVDEEAKTLDIAGGGYITLAFEGKPDCEYYLVLKGFETQSETSTLSGTARATLGDYSKRACIRGQAQTYYFEREYITYNLGYHEEAQTTCRLSFSKSEEMEYEDIYVVCVPMDDYAAEISELSEVVLENIVEGTDCVTGTIELEEPRLLTFSIPRADGWSLYVNGEERELIEVNVMYSGLILEPGSYEIELRYERPGQKLGNLISAIALGAILPVVGVSALRRKRKQIEKV